MIATADLIAGARAVIAAEGCTLLLIERTVRGDTVAIRIDAITADGSRTRGIARSGDPAMRTVCHGANVALRQLAAILPDRGRDRIGLMTDGTGATFSPDRLSVHGDGWLGQVLTGAAACIDIAPFDAMGHWARLFAPQHRGKPN